MARVGWKSELQPWKSCQASALHLSILSYFVHFALAQDLLLPDGLPRGRILPSKKLLFNWNVLSWGVHVVMLMTRRKHIEHADSWLGSSLLDSVDCSEIEQGICMKLWKGSSAFLEAYLLEDKTRQTGLSIAYHVSPERTSPVLSMPGVRSACERLLSERGIALKVAMGLGALKISWRIRLSFIFLFFVKSSLAGRDANVHLLPAASVARFKLSPMCNRSSSKVETDLDTISAQHS